MLDQIELAWFPDDRPDLAPIRELRAIATNFDDPHCPLWKFVGNEAAKRQLARAAFVAFERYNHRCNDQIFAFVGPTSSGKTYLAHLYAELVGLPLVACKAEEIGSVHDVMVAVAKVLEATAVEVDGEPHTLELREVDDGQFKMPPVIVLIDNFERLDPILVATLAKTLSKQRIVTERGWTFDVENVAWMVATSEPRSLVQFDGRLSRIDLRLYSRLESAMIVMRHFPGHPAEFYTAATINDFLLPNELLQFVRQMLIEREMSPRGSWAELAARLAEDLGIDSLGFTRIRKAIVSRLAGGDLLTPAQLAEAVGCSEFELRRIHLPPLLAETTDRPNILSQDSSGIRISEGMATLAAAQRDQNDSENHGVDSSSVTCPCCDQPIVQQDGAAKCPACNREFELEANGDVICIYLTCPSCGEECTFLPHVGEDSGQIQCDDCHLSFPVDEKGNPVGQLGKCVWCERPIWSAGIGSATCEHCGLENPVDGEGNYAGKGNVLVACPKCGHAFDAPIEVIEQGMDLFLGAGVAPSGNLPCEKCDHLFNVDLQGRLNCPGSDSVPCEGTLTPDGTETFANRETFNSFVCSTCRKNFIFHDQFGLIESGSHETWLMDGGCLPDGDGVGESANESEQE